MFQQSGSGPERTNQCGFVLMWGGAIGALRPLQTGMGASGEEEEAGMLVLDRKITEGFWIDNQIFVKVLSVGRRRVKLGIQAPDGISVVREELLEGSEESPNGRDHAVPGEQEDETLRSVHR